MNRNFPLDVMSANAAKEMVKAMQDPYVKQFIHSIGMGIDVNLAKGKTQYITTDIFQLGEYEIMAIERHLKHKGYDVKRESFYYGDENENKIIGLIISWG